VEKMGYRKGFFRRGRPGNWNLFGARPRKTQLLKKGGLQFLPSKKQKPRGKSNHKISARKWVYCGVSERRKHTHRGKKATPGEKRGFQKKIIFKGG